MLEGRYARAAELSRQRDPRFLLFVGFVVAAIAIGLKSELLTPRRVWALGILLVFVALGALWLYLRSEQHLPSFEHVVPGALGLVALTGLSFMVPEWWKYLLAAIGFAVSFFVSGYLDQQRLRQHEKPGHVVVQDGVLGILTVAAYLVALTSPLNIPERVVALFGISLISTYRSFRILGKPMPSGRAWLFGINVALAVGLFAWAMTVYVVVGEGLFAGMLLLAWYINRGVIRHAVEETLSRRVVVEFGILALFLAFLFWITIQPPG